MDGWIDAGYTLFLVRVHVHIQTTPSTQFSSKQNITRAKCIICFRKLGAVFPRASKSNERTHHHPTFILYIMYTCSYVYMNRIWNGVGVGVVPTGQVPPAFETNSVSPVEGIYPRLGSRSTSSSASVSRLLCLASGVTTTTTTTTVRSNLVTESSWRSRSTVYTVSSAFSSSLPRRAEGAETTPAPPLPTTYYVY